MFKFLFFSFVALPVLAQAKINSEQCADVGRTLEFSTLSSFTRDLNIDRSTILEHKTEVKVLGVYPVTDILAKQLAEDAYKKLWLKKIVLCSPGNNIIQFIMMIMWKAFQLSIPLSIARVKRMYL